MCPPLFLSTQEVKAAVERGEEVVPVERWEEEGVAAEKEVAGAAVVLAKAAVEDTAPP